MLGKGHAVSGVTVWLAGWATAVACGAEPGPDVIIVGAGLTAGAALLPDIDHPNSTISNCGGLLTRALAAGSAFVGRHLHAATKLAADRPDEDGHRTVTHTWIFGVLAGMFVSWLVGGLGADLLGAAVRALPRVGQPLDGALAGHYNAAVTAAVVYFFTKVGLDAALRVAPRSVRRVKLAGTWTPWSMVAAWACAVGAFMLVDSRDTWWVGLAVGGGIVVHTLGDLITMGKCPVLWPIPIPSTRTVWQRTPGSYRKAPVRVRVWRSWYLVGTPYAMRFRVGSPTETLVTWLLVAGGMFSAGALLWMASV